MNWLDLNVKGYKPNTLSSTKCPKCSEDRRKKNSLCLSVNDEEGNRWWKCNHCGWSGNLDVYEKYDKVYEKSGMKGKPALFNEAVNNFFRSKGLSPKLALEEGFYQTSKAGKLTLCYPIYKGRSLVNVKFRSLEKDAELKFWQISRNDGSEVVLLGLHKVKYNPDPYRKDKNTLVICEGETSMLTWKEAGVDNVVSVPEGAKQNPQDYMADEWSQGILKHMDLFYIAADDDAPGKELQDKLAKYLGKEKCLTVGHNGRKDANAIVEDGGSFDEVLNCLSNAKPFPIKGLVKASDVIDDIMHIREYGWDRGQSRDISTLDDLFTYKQPYLYVFTGVPKSGKSTFVMWDLVQLIKNNKGMKWVVFSPEMRPSARFYSMLIQMYLGKKVGKNERNAASEQEINHAVKFIDEHFFLIAPDRNNFEDFSGKITKDKIGTLEFILEHVSHLSLTENIYGYVIDPWNKIDHDIPRGMSETNFIGKQLDKVQDFNELNDLCSIVIAHPHKVSQKPSGNYEVPGMYNINGGANWYNKVDVGVVIHRDINKKTDQMDEDGGTIYEIDNNAKTKVIVKAVRFEELGNFDKAELRYSLDNNQFSHDDFKPAVVETVQVDAFEDRPVSSQDAKDLLEDDILTANEDFLNE